MLIQKAKADLERLLAEQKALTIKIAETEAIIKWLTANAPLDTAETSDAVADRSVDHVEKISTTDDHKQPHVSVVGTLLSPSPKGPDAYLGISVLTLREGFRAKSIADAAIVLLTIHGSPLTEREMVDGLLIGGVTLTTSKPVTNLRFSLFKKAKETNAIRLLPGSRWALSTWDNVEGVKHPNASNVSLATKSVDHIENSRRGLQAAQERGVKLGRPVLYPPETKHAAIKLMNEGMTIRETSRRLGVNSTTIAKWRLADSEPDASLAAH